MTIGGYGPKRINEEAMENYVQERRLKDRTKKKRKLQPPARLLGLEYLMDE
jgi:hypothetical protein